MQSHQLDKLKTILPNNVFTSSDEIKKHSHNQFYTHAYFPDAVCYAESEEDVIKITDFCVQHRIPLIPYGSGTSVEGHTAPVQGGICLNLSRMDKILEFNPLDHYVIVQPGLAYNKLNEFLEPLGFHFSVEAGRGASIGGMAATNASGAGALDAGSMAKNIFSFNVVSYENGKAFPVKMGTKSPKSSAGYNLVNLFIGSEGTLGVITEICLKIRKNFSFYKTICCQFDEIKPIIDFVLEMKGLIQFRRIELLDKLQTTACLSYSHIDGFYKDKNTVLIELAGNEFTINEEEKLIVNIMNKKSAENLKIFQDKKSADIIWQMRKNACPAVVQFLGKNKKAMATDISVPISKLCECIHTCYAYMKKVGLSAPLVSHVGDGNFHFTLLLDPEDKDELRKGTDFNKYIIEAALSVGGTSTGEHGIGLGKIPYLEIEHEHSLPFMRKLKEAFDPLNIFNPGKIFTMGNKLLHSNEFNMGIFSPSPTMRAKI